MIRGTVSVLSFLWTPLYCLSSEFYLRKRVDVSLKYRDFELIYNNFPLIIL